MNNFLRLAAISLLLTATLAQAQERVAPQQPLEGTNDIILAQEQRFWTSYVSADQATLTQLFRPDFKNVEQVIWTGPQVADFVAKFALLACPGQNRRPHRNLPHPGHRHPRLQRGRIGLLQRQAHGRQHQHHHRLGPHPHRRHPPRPLAMHLHTEFADVK